MTTVAIVPESNGSNGALFLAISGGQHSTGRTAGEALDALTSQLDDSSAGTLIVVQSFRPDQFFSEADQQRLNELMSSWRKARDAGGSLSPHLQSELDALIQAELEASVRRSEAVVRSIRP
jgi:hypothetical protein